LQQIAQQLEYRLIQRRIETGATGWAEWLEEDSVNHYASDNDEEQQDGYNNSDETYDGQCPVSLQSVTLGPRIAGTEQHMADSTFVCEAAVPPADELLQTGNEEMLAAGCEAMGQDFVQDATRLCKVTLPILLGTRLLS
jgi:hypothetical protein